MKALQRLLPCLALFVAIASAAQAAQPADGAKRKTALQQHASVSPDEVDARIDRLLVEQHLSRRNFRRF